MPLRLRALRLTEIRAPVANNPQFLTLVVKESTPPGNDEANYNWAPDEIRSTLRPLGPFGPGSASSKVTTSPLFRSSKLSRTSVRWKKYSVPVSDLRNP